MRHLLFIVICLLAWGCAPSGDETERVEHPEPAGDSLTVEIVVARDSSQIAVLYRVNPHTGLPSRIAETVPLSEAERRFIRDRLSMPERTQINSVRVGWGLSPEQIDSVMVGFHRLTRAYTAERGLH